MRQTRPHLLRPRPHLDSLQLRLLALVHLGHFRHNRHRSQHHCDPHIRRPPAMDTPSHSEDQGEGRSATAVVQRIVLQQLRAEHVPYSQPRARSSARSYDLRRRPRQPADGATPYEVRPTAESRREQRHLQDRPARGSRAARKGSPQPGAGWDTRPGTRRLGSQSR